MFQFLQRLFSSQNRPPDLTSDENNTGDTTPFVLPLAEILADKYLYAVEDLPLITIYDDNWFVRNDYDVLSLGQRNYLIDFFGKHGVKQKSGRLLQGQGVNVHLPRPNNNLAVSAFQPEFLQRGLGHIYCVTPTQFAEALFYRAQQMNANPLADIKALIEHCPYNIEWLRDVSYRSPIEAATAETFEELNALQTELIHTKFKMKKAL